MKVISIFLCLLFLIQLAPNMENWLDAYDKGEITKAHIMYMVRTHDRTVKIQMRALKYQSKYNYNCNHGYFLGWTW